MTIRLVAYALGLAMLTGWADAQAPQAFAWLGSWQAMEAPTLEAPEADGTVEGRLGEVFEAQWTRDGNRLTARFTTLNEGWSGRLGVELPCAGADTITLGYNDLPVSVPLSDERKGQVWWTWGVGVPRWVLGQGIGVLLRSHRHHGCFLINRDDGPVLQLCVDRPEVGESVEMTFELAGAATVSGLRAKARRELGIRKAQPLDAKAAAELRAEGYVRVSDDGWAFETGAGEPYCPLGRNLAHLPTLAPAEQEALLDEVAAARMNTVRILLPDYTYRPAPGVWNEEAIERLRESIGRCAARGVRVIICLEYSAAGHQYSNSIHVSPSPADLYLLEETLDGYAELVERVVKPLRDDPAILAWNVTNEPFVEPDPKSKVLAKGFGKALPSTEEYEKQSTPEAREFFTYAQGLLAEGIIKRGRLIREADPNHLVTLSGGYPRLLRGHEGAEVLDFWAPHTYDLWVNGPAIDHHCAFLLHTLRLALPDRPRPVMIEEYGIAERPQYADDMRTEHIAQFLAGGRRYGLAGLLHWWEMSPAMSLGYADAQPYTLQPVEPGEPLAVYLPPSQEWRLVFYPEYMTRRAWGEALVKVIDSGWEPRVVGTGDEVDQAEAVLVLGDALTDEETEAVKGMGLPMYVQAEGLEEVLVGAKRLDELTN